ncbi:protein of unknown function [Modestobacter italicus]|uniref:Uncharacterized protein n=1 Tax=Modestobacter italicus (strain DSM 44449 / CECT 9708 / BC 501) TaxID=2732864 RepID=I4EZI0_MODI5|nr:protein of unknown function [Modestobacter marinus]
MVRTPRGPVHHGSGAGAGRPDGSACHDRRVMDRAPAGPPLTPLPLAADGYPAAGGVTRRAAGPAESARANRGWWDAAAPAYLAEHGGDLGDADFLWCPEGLREADAHLLGDVAGRPGAGDRLRLGPLLALAPRCRGRAAGPRRLRWHAGPGRRAEPGDRARRPAAAGRRRRPAAGRRERGPGVLGLRRAAVRRRRPRGAGGGGPGAAPRRPVRGLGEPPDALADARLPRPRGPAGGVLLLRPPALRGDRRLRAHGLRRAPPHRRRLGARGRRRRTGAHRPRRAGVDARTHGDLGPVVPRPRRAHAGHVDHRRGALTRCAPRRRPPAGRTVLPHQRCRGRTRSDQVT